MADNDFTPTVRAAILHRQGGRCARCGRMLRLDMHHRRLRSQGGMGTEANGIGLCGSGTTGCHGWVHAHPAESYRLGYLVHSWDDPEDIPLPGYAVMPTGGREDHAGGPWSPWLDREHLGDDSEGSDGLPPWSPPG